MFEELNASLPDKQRYLERIGITGEVTPDFGTLDRLILAHLRHVPFENLDVYDAEAEISLDIEALYDKIVIGRRGGYCFELNALFMSLLKEIGYDCYPVSVRVVMAATGYVPAFHRAGIVTIDGNRYFCDVGFGGPSPCSALILDEPDVQQSGSNRFVFEKAADGDFVIYRLSRVGREQLLKFTDRRCENVDFLAPNEYQSKNKNSRFKNMRMVNLLQETGIASISNNILRIHKDGQVEETILDSEEKLRKTLRENFGLEVGFPLKV